MKKSEIETQMNEAHKRFLQVCEDLDETQASKIGVTEKWSIKDTISHVAFWHGQGIGFATGFLDGTWQSARFSLEQVAEINENLRGEKANFTLAEANAEFNEATAKVHEFFKTLPEEIDENAILGKNIMRTFVIHPTHHAQQIEEFRATLNQ